MQVQARLLMIAPQPFFESRGAPFCVYQHIKALTTLGYEVDLVTYHLGAPVYLPGLTIYRAPALPGIHSVKPGFSWTKFPLDLLVFFTVLWRLCWGSYRFLHTHEEAALMGIFLAKIFGCKHLYYMHCELSELVKEKPLMRFLIGKAQRMMIRHADTIIAFYPELLVLAKKIAPATPAYTILPVAVDEELPPVDAEIVAKLRQKWCISSAPILLYTGTLEQYQGIEILLRSVELVLKEYPQARYLIIGGKPDQVEKLRLLAQKYGIEQSVLLLGQRPLEEMPAYMALADVLLSPRCSGTHTPLKLYTYLRSGKPILATAICSHTQILHPDVALLVPPTVEGLVQGALTLLRNPEQARSIGLRGQQLALERYNWSVFLEQSRRVHSEFMALTGS